MKSYFRRIGAYLLTAFALTLVSCETPAPPPPPPVLLPPPPAVEAHLAQLVAPIALYSDPLVANILAASTYPLEIVQESRWIADPKNAALKGDALTSALAAQDWDPSVKSLAAVPMLLQMMNTQIDWTEALGNEFLSRPDDVMNAIQEMRRRALAAGRLNSNLQQTVSREAETVEIQPANPAVVYVPAYDPMYVYAPWPYPAFLPFSFAPWPLEYGMFYDGFAWGVGFDVLFPFWGWGIIDWHRHVIGIDGGRWGILHPGHRAPGEWQHDPSHRRGARYADPAVARHYEQNRDRARGLRGYDAPSSSQHRTPPAFSNFDAGHDVRTHSDRGRTSRQTTGPTTPSRGISGRRP